MVELSNPMIPMSQLTPRLLTWLWPQRLADGTLAMFDGDPGRGKSLVSLDLCARVSTGRPMPDGTGGGEPANAIIIQNEDSPDTTVLPRLKALGADLSRIFIFRQDFLDKFGPFSLPSGIDALQAALDCNGARLVVIDPIIAFLDRNLHAYSDQCVRQALTPLEELADKRGFVGSLVRHLNKKGAGQALYRGGGSIGFNACCRSSWLFDLDPADATRLVMAQLKNNYAPLQPSLTYRISQHEAVRKDGLLAQPTLDWLGPSDATAEQLLARAGRRPILALAQEQASDFLLAFLKHGPRLTEEIWNTGKAQGLAKRTLQLVRPKLGIHSVCVWDGTKNLYFWHLPGQKLPESIPPEFRPDNLEDLWGPLLEKYPVDPLADEE